MENKKSKDEMLYDTWEQHWVEEPKLTPVGKVFCGRRMKVMDRLIRSLDIKTALDAGCGFGYMLKLFKDAELDYVGLDVAPEAVTVCKQKELNAEVGRIEEREGEYDLVAAEGMLEHFLNFEPYAQHLMRMSSRYVMIMQPNHDSFTGRTLVYVTQILRGSRVVFEYNYQMHDYITVFKNNGFKLVSNEALLWDTSRLLLFEREDK